MQLPLTLPLANHLPRRLYLERNPPGYLYPFVLHIEVLSEQEATALNAWLPGVTLPPTVAM